MSEETLRAFSAEAKARADLTMNDYVYAFDLHGETTLYASDLAKVIADRDNLLEALEWYRDQMCEGFCADYKTEEYYAESMDFHCAGCKARAAIAKAKGKS